MLTIPQFPEDELSQTSYLEQGKSRLVYSDKMTLKQYIQAKNIQRRLQLRVSNTQQQKTTALSEKKQYCFEKQLHDIKGFIFRVLGEGSLYKKFVNMLDNLYAMFLKEITICHNVKLQTQLNDQDARFKEFQQTNDKLKHYLNNLQEQSKNIDQRLQHMIKVKQIYKKQREIQIAQRLNQEKEKQEALKRQIEQKSLKTQQKTLESRSSRNQAKRLRNLSRQTDLKSNTGKDEALTATGKSDKQLFDYNKKRQNIGKLSNIFASHIGQ